MEIALPWIENPNVYKINFEEMKKNIPGTIKNIFDFIGVSVSDSIINLYCQKYSFENITKRQRGEDGEIIRTGYMFRKGISGDWKNYFDEELKALFKEYCGKYLILLGYEKNNEW